MNTKNEYYFTRFNNYYGINNKDFILILNQNKLIVCGLLIVFIHKQIQNNHIIINYLFNFYIKIQLININFK